MTMTAAERRYLEWLATACGYRHARLLPGGRWGATYGFAYSDDILVGQIGTRSGYDGRWAYPTAGEAAAALAAWDGAPNTRPPGFPRQVATGRHSLAWRPVGTRTGVRAGA